MDFYRSSVSETYKKLNSSNKGLSSIKAKKELQIHGPNEVQKFKTVSTLTLLLNQIRNFMVYILIAAALVSFFVGELNDAIVIGVIIILNILLGFVQEYKAEKSIEALQKLSSPKSLVMRDGEVTEVPSKELVPGDLLVIEEGSYIPADARIVECYSLRIDESTFTGESLPVLKNSKTIKEKCIISDHKNIVFAGTIAVRGRGKALIFDTGSKTELGKIATEIQKTEENFTPLQKQLNSLGVYITVAILIICGIILALGFLKNGNLLESFLIAVALAVAAIPEGLPAVITITLALGTQRLSKKQVLIRRLPAVETLGSTTVICSDKTGTLTKNKMTVTKIYSKGQEISVEYKKNRTNFLINGKKITLKNHKRLFEVATLCNNATLNGPSDPTEKALLIVSNKSGFKSKYKRISEVPFNSESKYMITFNKVEGKILSYVKGAPEVVLGMCNKVEVEGKLITLTSNEKRKIISIYDKMASRALRVIAFGYHPTGSKQDFVFVGLMGMIDPPRENVKEAIAKCKIAGIRVVMITGDHAITANAIAQELGITGKILTGKELEEMSLDDLGGVVDDVGVFARVSPQHKVNILKALKNKGHVVAMTGDGVNDAPALKMADIGTAVGSGTDVAKEASDMVLLDDDFVSIVSAVMEGRSIYSNIKKFVNFLFSCNFGEVLVIFLALLLDFPLPLIAIQVLWVNLITDGFPALALGTDPIDSDLMQNPPRKKNEQIITDKDAFNVLLQGIVITFGVLFLFNYYLPSGLEYARTIAFSSLVLFQLFNVLNYRVGDHSIFSGELIKNRWLIASILFSLTLQFVVVYFLSDMFGTTALTIYDWFVCLIVSSSILLFYEAAKLITKLKRNLSIA